MEQRTLRLGDIVDDYCPRERRITNHAIVAIVDNAIRQTRCTTCDSEHVYKSAKVPRRRKDPAGAEAPGQLVAPRPDSEQPEVPEAELEVPTPADSVEEPVPLMAAAVEADEPADAVNGNGEPAPAEPDAAQDEAPDGWLAHRRLIRATLPRVDGEAPARPIPEFTMHQRQTRGSHMFRGGQGGNHSGNGQGGASQGRGGQGRSNGNGNGHGNGRGRSRSGRRHKRSR